MAGRASFWKWGRTDRLAERYREAGFVTIRNLLKEDQAARFRERALQVLSEGSECLRRDQVFVQIINNWTRDPVFCELTMLSKLHRLVANLAGVPLRLWHDQLLVKFPRESVPTEFHQDQPYWPHQGQPDAITAWIALDDVPEEQGCLSFIPGSHRWISLPVQDLADPRSLFEICPELEWMERVSVPLRAGDCTLHHGRTAHMAGANRGSKPRLGYAVIFMEDGTRFSGAPHPITDPLGLKPGAVLDGLLFPRAGGGG